MNDTSLENQQRQFTDFLKDTSQNISSWVKEPECIEIYQNNFYSSLQRVLKETFPYVAKTVGNVFFEKLAYTFIQAHPPEKAELDLYGIRFPSFIKDFEKTKGMAYLADLAQFEWLNNESYYAKDAKAISQEKMNLLGQEANLSQITLRLLPSIRLFKSQYPIISLRSFLDKSEETQETFDLSKGPEYALIIRPEIKVNVYEISHEYYLFLEQIYNGKNIEEAIAFCFEQNQEFNFQDVFIFLLQNGIIQDFMRK